VIDRLILGPLVALCDPRDALNRVALRDLGWLARPSSCASRSWPRRASSYRTPFSGSGCPVPRGVSPSSPTTGCGPMIVSSGPSGAGPMAGGFPSWSG